VVDDTEGSEIGFLLDEASDGKLATLSDRGGFLLARERDDETLVDRTVALISSIEAPDGAGFGLNCRALEYRGELVVGQRALTGDLAVVDRRIESGGGRLVDALRVWLGDELTALGIDTPIATMLFASDELAPPPSAAEKVWLLASLVEAPVGSDRDALLQDVAALSKQIQFVPVFDHSPAEVVRTLESHLRGELPD
jgi:hypothetical protein